MPDWSVMAYNALKMILVIHRRSDVDDRLCAEGCYGSWPCSTHLEAKATIDALLRRKTP